ncbi:MAG: prepilin-type N-terminal cleavage/methylation domain-containing protein [Patescibacteria group bacterium]
MRRGFTLIEIVIVTAIFGILAVGAVVSFQAVRGSTDLSSAVDFVKAKLEKSRLATLAKEDGSGWSVKVNEYDLIWFKGQTFNPLDPDNKTLILPVGTKVSSVNLENSGSAVFFNTLTGTTSPGTIVLALTINPAQISTLYISRSGQIYTSASANTLKPTTDTRHLHFDLGWSIQNAVELKFRFLTDPEDVRAIVMTPYFNTDQTGLDYTGSFTVAGQPQKIRVHTHNLDSSVTTLSIHRDLMNNSKPVEIYIDSKIIVTYAADSSAIVGAFGGTMTPQ